MKRSSIALLALAAVAGCASSQSANRPAAATVDTAARAAIGREDMLTQMTFWAQEVRRAPNDLEAMRAFLDVLRKGGRAQRAVEVGEQAVARFGPDRVLLMHFGMALVAVGRGNDAVAPLATASASDPSDWRVRSALGVALDHSGKPNAAREIYRQALAIKPDDPGLLTNLGVSFLMTGDSADAEIILRQAAALPGAGPETRMNLAVAIALQGRFEESERLQRIDLTPDIVAKNISYLRSLISSPNQWRELATDGSQAPEQTSAVQRETAPASIDDASSGEGLRGLSELWR
jgi:Flp pilus assembly protein TadD